MKHSSDSIRLIQTMGHRNATGLSYDSNEGGQPFPNAGPQQGKEPARGMMRLERRIGLTTGSPPQSFI